METCPVDQAEHDLNAAVRCYEGSESYSKIPGDLFPQRRWFQEVQYQLCLISRHLLNKSVMNPKGFFSQS